MCPYMSADTTPDLQAVLFRPRSQHLEQPWNLGSEIMAPHSAKYRNAFRPAAYLDLTYHLMVGVLKELQVEPMHPQFETQLSAEQE